MSDESSWWARLNNGAETPELIASLGACCAARSWIASILDGRPYADESELFAASDAATRALDDEGLGEALAAHPRIGERRPAETATTAEATEATEGAEGAEAEWSRHEQSGMSNAAASVQEQIADANRRYEQRFGHVYLVCASGLSAEQLLAICFDRLGNDPRIERTIVLDELAKIARLRLRRLMPPDLSPADATTGAPS